MAQDDIARNFNCKVLAIKQATTSIEESHKSKNVQVIAAMDSSTNMDFSQIEIAKLQWVAYYKLIKYDYFIMNFTGENCDAFE